MLARPQYVRDNPSMLSVDEKNGRQRTYGHINKVRVVAQNPTEMKACDCWMRQYCRITHFFAKFSCLPVPLLMHCGGAQIYKTLRA